MGDYPETNAAALAQPAPPLYADESVGIRKAENGFIVTVGCKVFIAKTWTEVSYGLQLYYKDPAAAVKKYLKEGV